MIIFVEFCDPNLVEEIFRKNIPVNFSEEILRGVFNQNFKRFLKKIVKKMLRYSIKIFKQ